jgi:hypothetical protein
VLKPGLAVVAIVFAVLAAGCGSSSDSGGEATAAGTITKAEYIKKANAICLKAREEIVNPAVSRLEKVAAEQPDKLPQEELKMVRFLIIPKVEEEVAQLRALGFPKGDKPTLEKFLKLTEDVVTEAEEEPETFVNGPKYKEGFAHYGKAYHLAVDYGMSECPQR